MNKEIVDNKTIELYLEKLVATFGARPAASEQLLDVHFKKGNYATCISEIKKYMRLENKLSVICYTENKYPYKDNSLARVHCPTPSPHINSIAFKSLTIKIEFRERLKNNLNTFVAGIAHELCHLVLNGTNHELRHSEVATDLCVLVLGFHEFSRKGQVFFEYGAVNTGSFRLGYLTEAQLKHALLHLSYLKTKSTKQPTHGHKPGSSLASLLEELNRLFK